jgi:hypothetical protein
VAALILRARDGRFRVAHSRLLYWHGEGPGGQRHGVRIGCVAGRFPVETWYRDQMKTRVG